MDLITLSIVLSALAFIILVIFLVVTLVLLAKSLKRTDRLIENSNEVAKNLGDKLHAFDPLFGHVSKVGEIVEERAEESVREFEDEHARRHAEVAVSALEFVEWGLIGLSLVMKLRKKK